MLRRCVPLILVMGSVAAAEWLWHSWVGLLVALAFSSIAVAVIEYAEFVRGGPISSDGRSPAPHAGAGPAEVPTVVVQE